MSKFVDCARDQAFLLPPDLRDWVPEDDLAHFVIEAVERVAIGAFEVNERGTGSAQYHPRMMLALLIYCYAIGIFSSRRIERATHRDIGVRLVAANRHPDHDTIATFRRRNFQAVAESFLQVLLLAKELKLVKVGVVSVDGSKVDAPDLIADASKHRSVTYERAGELVEQLQLEIADLLGRAEQADGSAEDDPQALPKEIGRLAALRAKLDAARQRLEAQAKARAEAERADWEAKVAAREARTGRAKGKHPKLPDDTPGPDEQSNLSDPDSRLMRRSKQPPSVQCAGGGRRRWQPADPRHPGQPVCQRPRRAGGRHQDDPRRVGQAGDGLGRQRLRQRRGGRAPGRKRHRDPGRDRRRGPQAAPRLSPDQGPSGGEGAQGRMVAGDGDQARQRGGPRPLQAPPADRRAGLRHLEAVLGFRGFSLRGLDKVTGEWDLVALAYNCKRLHKLQLELAS